MLPPSSLKPLRAASFAAPLRQWLQCSLCSMRCAGIYPDLIYGHASYMQISVAVCEVPALLHLPQYSCRRHLDVNLPPHTSTCICTCMFTYRCIRMHASCTHMHGWRRPRQWHVCTVRPTDSLDPGMRAPCPPAGVCLANPDFRNTGWGGGWSFGRLVWSMPDGRRLCVLVRKPPRLGPGSLPFIREGLGGFYLEVMASLRLLSVADMPTRQLRSEVCFRLHLRSRGRRGDTTRIACGTASTADRPGEERRHGRLRVRYRLSVLNGKVSLADMLMRKLPSSEASRCDFVDRRHSKRLAVHRTIVEVWRTVAVPLQPFGALTCHVRH